jgi:hypothetical protein
MTREAVRLARGGGGASRILAQLTPPVSLCRVQQGW